MKTTSLARYRSYTRTSAGFSCLHGTHHDAKKLRTTTLLSFTPTDNAPVPSRRSSVNAAAGLPTVPVRRSCGSRRNASTSTTTSAAIATTTPRRSQRGTLCLHRDGRLAHEDRSRSPLRLRQRGDERPQADDEATRPEPGHERDDEHADRGPRERARVIREEDRVDIVARTRGHPGRSDGLRRIRIEDEGRIHSAEVGVLPGCAGREQRKQALALWIVHRTQPDEMQLVARDLERLTG